MERKRIASLAAAAMVVLAIGCSSPVESSRDTPISIFAIPGVTAPVPGEAPATSLDASQYSGTISWSPTVSGTFAYDTAYTATVTLTPKAGYTLAGVAANGFTVAGASSVSNGANSGVVTAIFPSTSVATVSLLAIPGVTAPASGGTPVTSLDASQYSGAIYWNPAVSGTFAADTAYTATVTLTPKPGYTFTGVAANGFTMAGASSVSNNANSGVVTAVFPSTSALIIDNLTITGIAPVQGAAPVTSLDTSQYTATISWEPAVSGTFAPATYYSAAITLTPKTGYTLDGLSADSFTVVGSSSGYYSVGSGAVTAYFPSTSAETISLLAIPDIAAPALGEAPVLNIDTSQYFGSIEWSPTVSGTFAAGRVYTATVTLTPKSDYTLNGVKANSFTVAGATSVSNSVNSGVVTAVFPPTSPATISLVRIPGVTAPVVGATPVTSLDADQYTGTIGWSPTVNGTFAGETAYTATVTLTPKSGYTLTGVTANCFTIEGASASNSADSGVVTAVFDLTSPAVITLLAIPGITPPVLGATPVKNLETDQYTATVSWNPGIRSTFIACTEYTATISLTAKHGFTYYGVAENSFTVAGASSVRNMANHWEVTAVFPMTSFTLTMVDVPAGRFQRDSTAGNDSVVSAFKISNCEITRGQFKVIFGIDPSNASSSTGNNDPVQMVNFYHAIAFCNKLSVAEGLTPVYSVGGITDWAGLAYSSIPTTDDPTWKAATATWTNNGYRLPTEMEWMWAAIGAPADGRGGLTNTTGYLKCYAGSAEGAGGRSNINTYVWCYDNSARTTHPVGNKAVNELNLCDMSGNVDEFCWDMWTDYPTGILTDYSGPSNRTTYSSMVIRGDNFGSSGGLFSLTNRGSLDQYYQSSMSGFRVVRR